MTVSKILVTGVGGDIGVNVLRALKETEYGKNLIGCDCDPYAWGRVVVDDFLLSPYASEQDAYLKFIHEAIRKHRIGFIFPCSEQEILFFHRHRRLTGQATVLINNALILDHFLDKYKTVQFLKKHDLPHPRTYFLSQYSEELSFPFILKKNSGSGSKLVLVVESKEELDFYRKKYRNEELIVQEQLGSKDEEYTAGIFSDGTKVYSILFRRYLASEVGITKFAELIENERAEELAIKIAHATQLTGSINCQMRKVGDQFIPFEINPRISGTAYTRHYFGFRDIEWCLHLANNKPVMYRKQYAKGVAVRALQEVFLDVCKK